MLDAHEYSPKEFEDLWRWRVFLQASMHLPLPSTSPRVASMTTVCQGIAEAYQEFLARPKVVLSTAAAAFSRSARLTPGA